MLNLRASCLNGLFLSVGQNTATYSQYFRLTETLTAVHKYLFNAGHPKNFQKLLVCMCLTCVFLMAANAVPDEVAELGPSVTWCWLH